MHSSTWEWFVRNVHEGMGSRAVAAYRAATFERYRRPGGVLDMVINT
jgi:hypothetical protein